jgi:voltage-gated potassium channel
MTAAARLRKKLTELYEADGAQAHRFRYGLLLFDVFTICFLVATSFTSHSLEIGIVDAIVGFVLLVEFLARLWICSGKLKFPSARSALPTCW